MSFVEAMIGFEEKARCYPPGVIEYFILLNVQFTREMFASSLKFVHKIFIRYCPSTSKVVTCIFRHQHT